MAWDLDKWLQAISIMLFKKQCKTTKKLKELAVLNLKHCCIHCYVTLSHLTLKA